MFSFLASCVKYGFYTSVIVGVGAGFFLNKTLPSDDSFSKFISTTSGTGCHTLDSIGLAVATNTQISNFVVFKLATVAIGKDKLYYGGALHNWAKLN